MKGDGVGKSDEWYTPRYIIDALGLKYDLDPCSPGEGHWIPAKRIFTKRYDGLSQKWVGMVFMNPPFGARNAHVPWLEKFIAHGNGIAIVRSYTSAKWFQGLVPKTDYLLFPNGKTKFIRADGTIGKSPSQGVVILSMGEVANKALINSNLGIICEILK